MTEHSRREGEKDEVVRKGHDYIQATSGESDCCYNKCLFNNEGQRATSDMVSCKDYVRRHGGSFFPDGDWRDRLLAPLYSPCFASISDIFQVFPFEQNRLDSSAVHKGNSNYDLKVCKSFSEMRERHIGLSGIRMLNKKKGQGKCIPEKKYCIYVERGLILFYF